MKKLLACVLAGGMVVMSLSGCGGKSITPETEAATEAQKEGEAGVGSAETTGKKIKIGFVVGTGGLGDQAFNDIAYEGLKKAEAELGIELEYAEPQSVSDFEPLISQFAQDGSYDLILSLDQQSQSALEKIAALFPDQKFSAVDMNIEADNVKVIKKDFAHMAFLPGYFAGLITADPSFEQINEAPVVGIMLGADNPNMQNGVLGYTAGAKLANPDIKVLTGVVGSYGDPAKGKDTAKVMYDKEADIILNFAGGSGLGLTNQAVEMNRFVLGGTSNVNHTSPDHMPACAVEMLSNRIYDDVQSVIDGSWKPGIEMGTIVNGGVDIVFEGSNIKVSQEIIDKIEKVRSLVVSGEITLPGTAEEVDSWVAATGLLLEN